MTVNDADARAAFHRKVHALEGLRIHAVDYWDIHNYGPEPARWDYGDWHHAVMGVQLSTDAGPVTVTWTSTFYAYGVEVFAEPIERHLVLGEDGPERIGPDGISRWTGILDTPVLRTTTSWERIELGPATLASGEVVEPARVVEIPTALRLDFSAGPVWFAPASPQYPSMERAFTAGDEIMIVFSAAKMRDMGYDDPSFVA
ncbi:hypothetical protein [Kribbella sp. VKM Ac-2566]|uniref:hypothetical protein n=1 Tax=Kribbella sp. VKM Ac-2566 TaxID=2512218 RepID=UPI0010625934|nr:hypothetical protein [Kribbella sp. VKM Ac-2566]TDW81048.1 hypothetical protein EV647_7690 [Kribbella sp. VKM Ac-2566]